MGIIWIFIVAVVAVIVYYFIANRSPKEVAGERETPERTPVQPDVSEANPRAETTEKKEAEGSPPPPPSPPPAP